MGNLPTLVNQPGFKRFNPPQPRTLLYTNRSSVNSPDLPKPKLHPASLRVTSFHSAVVPRFDLSPYPYLGFSQLKIRHGWMMRYFFCTKKAAQKKWIKFKHHLLLKSNKNIWLVRTTPNQLRPFARHLVGKMVILKAHLLITKHSPGIYMSTINCFLGRANHSTIYIKYMPFALFDLPQ